jgi:hypothetical protein
MFGLSRQVNYLGVPSFSRTAKTITLGATDSYGTGIYGNGMYNGGGNSGYRHTYTEASGDFYFGTGDYTIEFWAYSEKYQDDNRPLLILTDDIADNDNPTGVGGADFVIAVMLNSGSALQVYIPNGSGSVSLKNFGGSQGSLNQWIHYAVSRSGGTLYGFQNGTLLPTTFSDSTDMKQTAGNTLAPRVWIGGTPDSGEVRWGGSVDDVRITKGAGLYTSSFTAGGPAVNTANTVLLWHADNNTTDDTTSV